MVYCPALSVTVERTVFVNVLVAVTVAPTTTAPDVSVTLPAIVPVVSCA
jgi:hypothetical protein